MTDVETLGVVGAGPMGAGIVQIGLTAGMNVILFDLSQETMETAKTSILGFVDRMVEKGRLDKVIADTAGDRLTLASELIDLSPADLIVEAIIERLEPKQKLFADLESVVRKDTVLATNTSSLSVAEIASQCADKSRICGLHFFNPVPLMRLVEVIAAPATNDETIDRATAFAKAVGKTPVTVKDGPGFLVNLQGRAYSLEALAIAQEQVATPAVIDRIMRDAAQFRMGPFELMDLTGIDVNYAASKYIYEGYQHDPRLKTTTLHALYAAAGLYGRKTGTGFFEYGEGVEVEQSPTATSQSPNFKPAIAGNASALEPLADATGWVTGDDVTLIALTGEDCASACARLGLDPKTTVAIDMTAFTLQHLTVMAAVGGEALTEEVADWLRGQAFKVEVIKDSPGFVLQRMLATMANLACELAQTGVAPPETTDLAMKLAQNYPKGPVELGEWMGAAKTYDIMKQLHDITASDRYRPSLWLRRRAQLELSLYAE